MLLNPTPQGPFLGVQYNAKFTQGSILSGVLNLSTVVAAGPVAALVHLSALGQSTYTRVLWCELFSVSCQPQPGIPITPANKMQKVSKIDTTLFASFSNVYCSMSLSVHRMEGARLCSRVGRRKEIRPWMEPISTLICICIAESCNRHCSNVTMPNILCKLRIETKACYSSETSNFKHRYGNLK